MVASDELRSLPVDIQKFKFSWKSNKIRVPCQKSLFRGIRVFHPQQGLACLSSVGSDRHEIYSAIKILYFSQLPTPP